MKKMNNKKTNTIKKSSVNKSNVKKKITKKKPSKKGFTLIEILAVIIIIGIVAIIAVPSVSKYLGSSKSTAYTSYEHSMEDAAKNKIIDCLSDNSNCDLPENGEEAKIYLDLLIEEGYLDNMKDPESKSFCEQLISYVSIIGDNESNYKYQACLYCGDYYTENDECRKIEGDQENPTCGTAIGESTRWTNQNRTITIGCSDPSSGCLQTVFSKTFTKTTPEGKGNITIRDRSGNTTACEVNAYVDKDLPTCNIKGEGEYIDSVGWYSISATAKIEDMDDTDSGLLTYGMGTSIKNKEYNKQNSLTLGSGITTVIGYVKDIAGNEGICTRDFRVGTEVPKYNMYYGYQIYPAKEAYTLSGITESGTLLTTAGENPTITFSGLDKYKNVEKIKIKLNNQIEESTIAEVTYGGKTAQGVMPQGLSEIVVNLEKGTYGNIVIQLGNINGKQYNIKTIELLTSDGSTWTNKDMTLNIEPVDRGMKTEEVSYENGASGTWETTFNKTFSSSTTNKVVTRNGILMESEKKDYTMKIDKTLPIASIKATKKTSGTNVPTNTWVNEGLNFVFTQEASGSSGAKIYYCQDTTNTCTPNIEIPSGQVVTNYNNITTNYYIRFVTKSISGVEGITNSYFAKYDTTKPVCTFASAPTVYVNRTATLDLNCTDTQSGVVNNNLSINSFTLNNNNLSIESVTKSTITNGIKYTLTLKGAHHGNTSITLNSNTVSDIALNKNNSVSINDIKVNGVFKVTLNNQSATNGGTSTIYELYTIGWYTDSTVTNAISKITVPTRTGYTFGGYYTEANGAGTQIIDANGNILSNKQSTFLADATIYAKWTANELIY